MMEEDDLYKKYVIYLKGKLDTRILSISKYKLLLISCSSFLNFKDIYYRSNFLKEKIDRIYIQEKRDENLNHILKNE